MNAKVMRECRAPNEEAQEANQEAGTAKTRAGTKSRQTTSFAHKLSHSCHSSHTSHTSHTSFKGTVVMGAVGVPCGTRAFSTIRITYIRISYVRIHHHQNA